MIAKNNNLVVDDQCVSVSAASLDVMKSKKLEDCNDLVEVARSEINPKYQPDKDRYSAFESSQHHV